MKEKKKEPWRYVVAAIAVIYIIYMWVEKDLVSVYGNLPSDQMLPMVVTSVVVTLVKVAGLAVVVFLVKWLIGKFKK